jgi:Mg/Co/Ni transporter MgtE
MATLTVEIEDKELAFFKSLLKRLPFVKITEIVEDSDEEVRVNIAQSVKELQLVEQGKLASRPAREFLKEL